MPEGRRLIEIALRQRELVCVCKVKNVNMLCLWNGGPRKKA